MMSKCNCFDESLEAVKGKIIEKLPEGFKDLGIEWQNKAFIIGDDKSDYSPVNPKVLFEYRVPKKGGGFRKNKAKGEISLFANFCCYCGRELQKSKSS